MQEDEEETVQGKCAACEAEETLRPKESPAAPPAMTPAAESAIRSLGSGQPLPAAERAFFEKRRAASYGRFLLVTFLVRTRKVTR